MKNGDIHGFTLPDDGAPPVIAVGSHVRDIDTGRVYEYDGSEWIDVTDRPAKPILYLG